MFLQTKCTSQEIKETNKQIVVLFHFVHRKCVCSHTCILCRQGRLHRFLVYNHCLVAVHTNKNRFVHDFQNMKIAVDYKYSLILQIHLESRSLHYRANECKEIKKFLAYFPPMNGKGRINFRGKFQCYLIDLSWLG